MAGRTVDDQTGLVICAGCGGHFPLLPLNPPGRAPVDFVHEHCNAAEHPGLAGPDGQVRTLIDEAEVAAFYRNQGKEYPADEHPAEGEAQQPAPAPTEPQPPAPPAGAGGAGGGGAQQPESLQTPPGVDAPASTQPSGAA